MLENIRNVITRLPMDRLRPNLGGHIPSCLWHDTTILLIWQRPLPSNGALNILQLWASGGWTHKPILMKFGTQQQVTTKMTVTDQMLKFIKFKMADGRHVGKYWKYHNSPSIGPIGTKLGCSHPITFSTCLLRLGWDIGVLCVIGLLALMNNNIYWIFLKNSKYLYTQILYSFVGRDTFKAALCPTHYNSKWKKNASSHNTRGLYHRWRAVQHRTLW